MNFKKLQRLKKKTLKSKYTPDSAKEAIRLELLGKCIACKLDGKDMQAIHDRFGKPLCDKHQKEVQEKIDDLKKRNE